MTCFIWLSWNPKTIPGKPAEFCRRGRPGDDAINFIHGQSFMDNAKRVDVRSLRPISGHCKNIRLVGTNVITFAATEEFTLKIQEISISVNIVEYAKTDLLAA